MSYVSLQPAPRGEAALLLADHPALDLLNTVAAPRGVPLDWISDGEALLDWLHARRLLTQVERLRVAERMDAADLDAAAETCRGLREWLRVVVDEGPDWATVDKQALEAVLAEDWSHPVLDGKQWARWRDFRTPKSLLGHVAESIGDFLMHADRARVRHCEGEGCSLWFLDVSKTNRRRWCSMAVCGNRAKVAAHRSRYRRH